MFILDTDGNKLLGLDPRWIQVSAGTESNITATLREFGSGKPRGLRGISVPASSHGIRPLLRYPPDILGAYWLEYRYNASENGLLISLGSDMSQLDPLIGGSRTLLSIRPCIPQEIKRMLF